jgi:NAD(P)-dependent dehydrogenase (short-subunit alcohol dehydrogenase family)
VVAIVGAGRGIGEGLADRFARAGAIVLVIDLDLAGAQRVADQLTDAGLSAFALGADITQPDAVGQLFSSCAVEHGRLDVLVNSAGFAERRAMLEVDEAYWDTMADVNLKGPFFCLQAAARIMIPQGRGRIINLGSVGGYAAQKDLIAYNAAKGGISLLTKAAALELGAHGITVNTVAPGGVEGPWNEQFFSDPDYRRRWNATVPLGRMATNDDVAAAVLFLAAEESQYLTGQTLYVEGGKLSYVPGIEILDGALRASKADSNSDP